MIAAVNFARDHGLQVAVRGGGHGVAGHAVCDGGMMIDLSNMRAVRVDPATRRAWVQGGATWGDVDCETTAFNLATPGGLISTTGVGGLTLSGGVGWLRGTAGSNSSDHHPHHLRQTASVKHVLAIFQAGESPASSISL